MSGEGKVVTENAEMANGQHGQEEQTRASESLDNVDPPVVRVEPGIDGATSKIGTDTSEEEKGSHISDDGDHEKSAAQPADDFPVPDDEQRNKIIKQVEFYFSDANILKDTFLLKHVRLNKKGYVSLKLIASFKKMKSLTKDVRVIAYSLRQSVELEVNENGTKVRRREPIPEYDETTPFRTVVAVNLTQKNPTVELLAQDFSKCGETALIRILRPGQSIPPDVNKYANKHPEIGTAVCAVIEFKKYEDAKKACKTMTNTDDWRNGMRVVLLASEKKKSEKTDGKKDRQSSSIKNDTSPKDVKDTQKKKNPRKKKTQADQQAAEKNSCSSNGSDGEGPSVPLTSQASSNGWGNSRTNHLSSRTSPGSSPHNQHCRHHEKPQNCVHRPNSRSSPEMPQLKIESCNAESSASSPWVQRRLCGAQDSKVGGSVLGSPAAGQWSGDSVAPKNSKMLNMIGVLRQPNGPDGTKGFCYGLGRGKPQRNVTIT